MIEHRLSKRLMDYWDKVRQQNPLPAIEKFNCQDIDDLWQKCFQVSVITENGRPVYTYDFIGKELEIIFGQGLAGQKVTAKLGFLPAKKMIEQMEKSLRNPFPISLEGQFINEQSKVIKYRCCMLPFGGSKTSVTHFIVGISWKAF